MHEMPSTSEPTIDLDAYFERVGYEGPRTATFATLRSLHARHPARIPFENIDVLLGHPIRLDPPSLIEKLVEKRRGGYCFEQNGLFAAVLVALGFRVTGLSGRVRWNVPPTRTTARTHMALVVELDSHRYLCDVGFGGMQLTAPLELDSTESQATPHEPHRIVHDGADRVLQVQIGDGAWADLYRFTLEEQHRVDYELASWYTSTHPQSRFVQNLVVASAPEGRRCLLFNDELTVRSPNGVERRKLASPGEVLDALASVFDLHFPAGTVIPRPPALR